MGYRFNMSTIYANAFHAVNGLATWIGDEDINEFENLLALNLCKAVATGEPTETKSAGLSFDDDGLGRIGNRLRRCQSGYLLVDGPITNEELESANLCLGEGVARKAFDSARCVFRNMAQNGFLRDLPKGESSLGFMR